MNFTILLTKITNIPQSSDKNALKPSLNTRLIIFFQILAAVLKQLFIRKLNVSSLTEGLNPRIKNKVVK